MTNVAEKPNPFGAAHTHIAHITHIRELSPCITSLVLFLNQILDWVPHSYLNGFSTYYVYTCMILILIGASDNSR